MKKNLLKNLCLAALLSAIQIVLTRFCAIPIGLGIRLGLGFIPVIFAALLLGPLWAGGVGAVADVLGALIFPSGTYHPGFTAVAFLMGVVFGLLIKKCPINSFKFWAFAVLAVVINNLGLGLFINSFWLSQLYGSKTYWGWVIARLPEYAVMVPLQIIFIPIIKSVSERIIKSFHINKNSTSI